MKNKRGCLKYIESQNADRDDIAGIIISTYEERVLIGVTEQHGADSEVSLDLEKVNELIKTLNYVTKNIKEYNEKNYKLSFEKMQWRAYFRINSQKKVGLMIRNLEKIIGQSITVTNSQQYWKDKDLYEIEFTTSLGIEEIERAVFEALRISRLIGYDCNITGPNCYEGEKWRFEGIINRTRLSGLEWIHFNIQNYLDNTKESN